MPENFATFLSTHPWIFILAAAWTIPWKGVALWRAARNKSVAWFVALLIINTFGILDIIYIFAFSGKKNAPRPVEKQNAQKTKKIVLDVKKEDKPLVTESPKGKIPEKDAATNIQIEEIKTDIDKRTPNS